MRLMSSSSTLLLLSACACACAVFVAAGCTPKAAAPPDLEQVPELKSSMWNLAVATNRVVDVLDKKPSTTPLSPEELAQVKGLVDDIAKIAAGLAVDDGAQRHPLVKANLGEFQKSVTQAQAGLAKDPADLEPAKKLTAQCRTCHARGTRPAPFTL